MHSLIASRLARESLDESSRNARDTLEVVVSSVSRLSGYVAMGVALIGIAFLIF